VRALAPAGQATAWANSGRWRWARRAPRAFVLSALGRFFCAGPPTAVRAVAMRVVSEPGVLLTLAGMIRAFLLGQGPSAKRSPSSTDTDLA